MSNRDSKPGLFQSILSTIGLSTTTTNQTATKTKLSQEDIIKYGDVEHVKEEETWFLSLLTCAIISIGLILAFTTSLFQSMTLLSILEKYKGMAETSQPFNSGSGNFSTSYIQKNINDSVWQHLVHARKSHVVNLISEHALISEHCSKQEKSIELTTPSDNVTDIMTKATR